MSIPAALTTFDLTIIIGGLCGLVMIVGSMGLLYKGIIKLNEASAHQALSVEFQKMIKITSHYPALGLFIIGLIFVGGAAYMAQPPAVKRLTLHGRLIKDVNSPDPSEITIQVEAGPWVIRPTTTGEIQDELLPNLDWFTVRFLAPGCESRETRVQLQPSKPEIVSIGDVPSLIRTVSKPDVKAENILPTTAALPPPSSPGRF